MAPTTAPEQTKEVIVEEKYDADLDLHLTKIINAKHKYVNPTLKRLANLCKVRLAKLKTAKQ